MRNPKLLTLLRQGCEIRYPLGFYLKGILDRNFIETGYRELGEEEIAERGIYYIMNEKGLESALQAKEEYSDGDRDDKELAIQERKGEMG